MHRKSMEAAHSLSSEVLQEREEEDGRGSRGTDTIEVGEDSLYPHHLPSYLFVP